MQNLFKIKFALWNVLIVSTIALISAYIAEYCFDILPCKLCHFDRALYAVIAGSVIFLISFKQFNTKALTTLLTLFVISLGLSMYHVAVEYKWVPAPESCKSKIKLDDTPTFEELREQLMAQKQIVRCDVVSFRFLQLSLAQWNLILKLLLIIYLVLVFRRKINDR